MQQTFQITFHGIDRSEAVEARIRHKMTELDRKHPGSIMSCHATVEAPHRHGHQGTVYSLHLDIRVPGKQITVNHGNGNHAHEDVYVAIRDAFDAATRRLDDHVRRRSRNVKTHEVPLHGTITKLFRYEGYGFVTLSDGLEVYFQRPSVALGGFEALSVGDEVRIVLAEGEGVKGPQASAVIPIGKHHIVED